MRTRPDLRGFLWSEALDQCMRRWARLEDPAQRAALAAILQDALLREHEAHTMLATGGFND